MANIDSFKGISEESEKLIGITNLALNWVEEFGEEGSKSGVGKTIKKYRRSLKKIKEASGIRPSVAIFGQSQVGKSYLVQNLTKPNDSNQLDISLKGADEDLCFINDINPLGGKESTGVVTRFTVAENGFSEDFPIKVELFNQLDIASILANAYLSDLKDWEIDFKGIEGKLQSVIGELSLSGKESIDITEDDVSEFVEYLESSLMNSVLTKDLERAGYFKKIIKVIPYVGIDKRWKLLEFLWGKNEFVTSLFVRLTEGIKNVGSQRQVFVGSSAITPNSITILDVQRVKEIFDTGSEVEKVKVRLSDGSETFVDRSIFSCLTREVELRMANDFSNDPNRNFIERCDVLDFPGSKSREKIPESVFNSNNPEQQLQLFIRGKVSYLFDTYTFNQGMSSLLYCMDNHPPEEQEAPARLKKWINKYIGKNVENRQLRMNEIKGILKNENIPHDHFSPLMVVLTKFNVELAMYWPGKESDIKVHNSKWEARMEENFNRFMSRPVKDKWINNWYGDNKPFNFVFPIRDPAYSSAFFGTDMQTGQETEIREEKRMIIDSMGKSFNSSDVVKKYVPGALDTWKELISPNGTGVNNLCKYLTPATHPSITTSRLSSNLDGIKRELVNMLKPHVITGNIDEDLKQAVYESTKAWMVISGISINSPLALSLLLRELVLNDVEVLTKLFNLKFNFENKPIKKVEKKVSIKPILNSLKSIGANITEGMDSVEIMEEFRKVFLGFSDDDIETTIKDEFGVRLEDFLVINNDEKSDTKIQVDYAGEILQFWNQKLLTVIQKEELTEQFTDKQRDAIILILNEIIKAEDKFGLRQKLSEVMGDLMSGVLNNSDLNLVASCCCTMLNNYLFTAGWGYAKEDDKPDFNSYERKIFSDSGLTVDEATFTKYKKDDSQGLFITQWAFGCKHLFEENVRHEYGLNKSVDNSGNVLLKKIMSELDQEKLN